jgi:hypothetical protein
MRCTLTLVITVLFFSIASAQKKDEINFSDAFQLDSSEYFLIPRLLDDSNKDQFDKGKGYVLWGNYTDILFYNTKTNQVRKLFEGKSALIAPFLQKRNSYYSQEKEPDLTNNILPRLIIYSVRSDDFNGDKVLDSDDPSYLYVSTKTGEQLKQITPNGFHVISWTVSKDKKIILVKGQNDKNKNKKFGNGDDQLYYRIDLNDDISKIQCYQVNL